MIKMRIREVENFAKVTELGSGWAGRGSRPPNQVAEPQEHAGATQQDAAQQHEVRCYGAGDRDNY